MPAGPADRLDSWKQIAAYLQRSVRTVRRWEREEGLPIHRHVHQKLGSVFAHKSEIDGWRDRASRVPEPAGEEKSAAKSIAVLPFINLSVGADDDYFAAGLTEEVTIHLSRLHALRVTSPTSASRLHAAGGDVKAVSSKLGVRYIVDGTVRRAGDRIRITARLVDATIDSHLWADTYDGTIEDVFAIQERLACVIVEALHLRLTPAEEQTLGARPIDNVAAYECYLRARHEGWGWRKDSIDRAVSLLREGIRIIGDNARLYAALGFAYLQYREAGIDLSDRPVVEAEQCARRLNPSSAAGRQLRGWIHYARGELIDAIRELEGALADDPSNADTLLLLSNCYLLSGRVAKARPLIALLTRIDPLTPLARCMPAYADIVEGRPQSAMDAYREMFEMDRSNPMTRLFYIWVLLLNKRDATEVLDGFPAETRETVPGRLAAFLTHAVAGNEEKAEAALSQPTIAAAKATDVFARFLADGFAMLGNGKAAIDWLSVAIDRGFINYAFLAQHDPFLAGIRSDPRFETLLVRVRELSPA